MHLCNAIMRQRDATMHLCDGIMLWLELITPQKSRAKHHPVLFLLEDSTFEALSMVSGSELTLEAC